MATDRLHLLDLSRLDGPPLQRMLQLVCEQADSPADACSLLTTSKWMRYVTQRSCAGLVPVKASSEPQRAFAVAAWLKQNLSLARSLSINLPRTYFEGETVNTEDRQAVVSSLIQALQTPTSVSNISSCCLTNVGPECVGILQQLPNSKLTSLRVHLWQPGNAPFTGDQLRGVAAALSQLQQLQSLRLGLSQMAGHNIHLFDRLLEPLSGMTRLTSVMLEGVGSNAPLRRIPTSLQELVFSIHSWVEGMVPINLDHLTALTSLSLWLKSTLCHGSVLPASLQHLSLGGVMTVAPLLQLTQLKDLSLTCGTVQHVEGDSLAQLSTLRTVTSLSLCYEGFATVSMAAATAPAWAHLPIRKLCIRLDNADEAEDRKLAPDVVQHMSCLTQLTCLVLSRANLSETSSEEFAVVLRQLTALERLFLIDIKCKASGEMARCTSIDDDSSNAGAEKSTEHEQQAAGPDTKAGAAVATATAAGFEHVAAAIASLIKLRALDLTKQQIDLKAASHLSKSLGDIYDLTLDNCSLNDVTLSCILRRLDSVLQVLDVSDNKELTDAVLPEISMYKHSKHARYLSALLYGTQVTTAGVQRHLPGCAFVGK